MSHNSDSTNTTEVHMSFDDLNLIYPLQRALKEEGYTTPTPIQKQSIPHLLGGRDMIGIAQTGACACTNKRACSPDR
ncbi:MAG: ATP-dependent helicase RhlE [Methanolobus sp.]|nr:ATP-dependent helicase RhlE [Methanolobus sp.]